MGKIASENEEDPEMPQIDIEELMESGSFQEDQMDESAFCHMYGEGLPCCNKELLQPEMASQVPQFEVRSNLLYRINKEKEDQK